jgi:hypothetical protein
MATIVSSLSACDVFQKTVRQLIFIDGAQIKIEKIMLPNYVFTAYSSTLPGCNSETPTFVRTNRNVKYYYVGTANVMCVFEYLDDNSVPTLRKMINNPNTWNNVPRLLSNEFYAYTSQSVYIANSSLGDVITIQDLSLTPKQYAIFIVQGVTDLVVEIVQNEFNSKLFNTTDCEVPSTIG